MAGKQIGEFSFKITSLTFNPGANESVQLQFNSEGRPRLFDGPTSGLVALTVVCTPGKSGHYSTYGTTYLDNADIVTNRGSGSFESSGHHRWRTQADTVISDRRRIHTEGEIDLASRSWNGKIFEN